MRMVWPLVAPGVNSSEHLAPLQADMPSAAVHADVHATTLHSVLRRVAAVLGSNPIDAVGSDSTARKLAELAATGAIAIDILGVNFDGPAAASGVKAAFERIALQHAQQPYDAILLLGSTELEPDVGMLHTALAPAIATAGIAVLTAVGSDDANTILGDVATQVFATPAALLEHVATRLNQAPMPAAEAIERIRSLGGFMLTELAAESHILLDASIRPALQQQLRAQLDTLECWRVRVVKIRHRLQQRVDAELATVHGLRTCIDLQLTQHTQQRRLRSRRSLVRLRLLTVLGYGAFVALLWVSTSAQQLLFFSGCGLVLLSAVYTALSDRMLGEIDAIPVQASTASTPLRRDPTLSIPPDFGPELPSRLFSGAPMNDQPDQHVSRAYHDAADENLLLGEILQRLEQSDHLSLDELDALILQADAAYKSRLARLEHSRALIAGLGTAGEPA